MGEKKTVAELARLVGGKVLRGDPERKVARVMPIEAAGEDDVTFVTKPSYLKRLASSKAAAVLIHPAQVHAPEIPPSIAIIGVVEPYVAYARVASALAPAMVAPPGRHETSVVDETAVVDKSVRFGPFVVLGPGVVVGAKSVLHAGVHLEAGVTVGEATVLHNHVVIKHGCQVGSHCILHPGVVIGADGFGFAQAYASPGGLEHVKIPQLGNVVIEDHVEIGANSCVDRAALGTTRVGAGTKIDNFVQVAHNVEIGPNCLLVAQSGVAGSSRLGSRVTLGAQSGVSGHLTLGDDVLVLGQAGVAQDVESGQKIGGSPAVAADDWFRNHLRLQKLAELLKRVKRLEQIVSGNGSR